MKPWFIKEDNVVPFPKKDKGVVRLPNVNAYPDFLSGVQDLQNHLKNGDISPDIHKKLYQDLIQRFMRVESFETPWFIREAPADQGVMSLPQAQDRLAFITNYLKNNPAEMSRFHKILKQKEREQKIASGSTDVDDIAKKLQPAFTQPETDHVPLVKYFLQKMVEAEGDEDDMISFINNYGKVSYIDTKKLQTPNERLPIESWLSGSGKVSDKFIYSLFRSLFPKDAYGGPGETAMALLSPAITRPEGNKGDLVINGQNVEVKGESSKGGGRLKDEAQSLGTPNIEPIYAKVKAKKPDLNLPSHDRISTTATGREITTTKGKKFQLLNVAKAIDAVDKKLADEFMRTMLAGAFKKSAGSYNELFSNWRQMDYKSMNYAAAKMSYLNYKSELDAKKFNHILLLNLPKKTSLYFNTNDFDAVSSLFGIGSVDFGDKINAGAVQISL